MNSPTTEKTLIVVMKKLISTLMVCVALVSVSIAQDPNFSQFFASPLTLNPALTGKFDGLVRVAGNFRNQWPTINNAFVTKTASVDFGILKNRMSEIDQLGVGILGVSDNAGDGVLVTNYGGLSLAYHKGLDENGYHQVGAGFQATLASKRLDINKVKFGYYTMAAPMAIIIFISALPCIISTGQRKVLRADNIYFLPGQLCRQAERSR
jgi:type IX secretion system PorP/SprF family membrane protein